MLESLGGWRWTAGGGEGVKDCTPSIIHNSQSGRDVGWSRAPCAAKRPSLSPPHGGVTRQQENPGPLAGWS